MYMNYVHVVENVIPPDYCKHIIDKFERSDKKHVGYLGKGVIHKELKNSTDLHPSQVPGWKDEIESVDRYLGNSFFKYLKYLRDDVLDGDDLILRQMFSHLPSIDVTGIQIQRYVPGEYFNWHCDDAYGKKRLVAYIMYLNDMGIDDGGKTQFIEDNMEIIPKAGNILFFPSTWSYVHRGETVKRGKKYIITGFISEVLTGED
jgi:Rps23 Pro-64 3,4-dihydroxylase Tpa1-like proline 4-hydroxylase